MYKPITTIFSFTTILYLIAGFMLSSCNSNYIDSETDWSKENLKDQVKFIRTTIYSAIIDNDTVLRGEEIRPKDEFFDKNGYRKEILKFYSGGILNQKELYTYDRHGRLLTKKVYTVDNYIRFRVDHKYNKLGNETEVYYYDYKDSITSRIVYKYDDLNQKSEESNYIHGDSLAYRKTFRNGENGIRVEEYVYNSDGGLSHYTRYKYDVHGNETELKYFNPDGTANMIIKYHYDDSQNLTDEVFFRPDSLIARWNYEYQFDNRGNWISQTRFMNNNALDIFERQIEYYK